METNWREGARKECCGTCRYIRKFENKRDDEPSEYGCTYRNYEGYVYYNGFCGFYAKKEAP